MHWRNYVAQVDEMDCGVAALAMILKNYGSTTSLAYLRNIAKTSLEGTTALGLVKTAEKLGFETKAIQADMSLFDVQDLPLPFIVHATKNGDPQHFYVVVKTSKAHVVIADPDPTVAVISMSKEQFESEWSGVALFFAPKSEYKPVKQDKGSLWGFIPSLLKQRRLVINIVLAAVLITIISICGSYFLQAVIDTYIPNNMHSTLAVVAIGLIVFYTFQAIFTYAQNFLLAVLGQRLSIEIILGYIRHVFELPMSFFATRRTGEIVSRFTDASKIIDALASTIVSLFLDVSIVIIMGAILVIQNMTLFWITLLSLPIYAVVILAFNKSFERLNQKEMESNAILSSAIIEDLHGIETVKALNGETERYQKIDSEFVVLWVGANLVIHNQLSVGELMTYNALLAYFVNPLQNIINLQTKLQSAKVANNRLNEVYLVASEFEASRPIHNESQLNGDIKLQGVSYRYGYGENVLDDVNLTIRQHDKVAIVGMSGSGKSTLVKLLIDFYQPNSGDVILNGFNVKNIDKHTLRTHINYIPQKPYIFSATIEENLRLGNRSGITEKDIAKACQLALIDTDINKMAMQYQTKLDENGNTLSGGQRQRLTIARALLSPAQVLIFDESTSGLDAITEKQLIDNLVAMTDKTIIFIAHRLSIAKRTNHIIVLHDGRVAEEGTHAALLNEHGYYYDLINS
ncbi:bacteriocin ABC-transporter, ATP-binding and permease protein PlnG [Lactiplantibacillus plantarum]|nr:bacteriocin ABC-transporter, ATP-binding and permease protein PlnG [Lactiplantibacillus plantarum]